MLQRVIMASFIWMLGVDREVYHEEREENDAETSIDLEMSLLQQEQ